MMIRTLRKSGLACLLLLMFSDHLFAQPAQIQLSQIGPPPQRQSTHQLTPVEHPKPPAQKEAIGRIIERRGAAKEWNDRPSTWICSHCNKVLTIAKSPPNHQACPHCNCHLREVEFRDGRIVQLNVAASQENGANNNSSETIHESPQTPTRPSEMQNIWLGVGIVTLGVFAMVCALFLILQSLKETDVPS